MAALAQRSALSNAQSLSTSYGASNKQSSRIAACLPARVQAQLSQYEGLRKGAMVQTDSSFSGKVVTKFAYRQSTSVCRAVATEVEKETEVSLNIAEDVTEVSSLGL